ncbi:MAG: PilZ domain-containing protein [Dehalococcoidia bacterium]|nr:PilZ domain-containing protein [Dehalococcoidia bacterium]
MDEDIGPIAAPVIGAPAIVIPRTEAPGGRGTLVADRLFAIVLAVPHAPWSYGDDVIVSVGERGSTVAALARFREARPGQAVFTRQSPWRPFNRRAFARYTVSIAAAVTAPPARYPAAIVDVSLGGCAIQVPEPPPGGDAAVFLDWPGIPGPIPVTVVRHRPAAPAGFTWHLRFSNR